MKKTREERFRAFHKIVKCIDSCKTGMQTVTCDRMIMNFCFLFKKDFPDITSECEILYEESFCKNKQLLLG